MADDTAARVAAIRQHHCDCPEWCSYAPLLAALAAAEQRAARLAALEQAARAWRNTPSTGNAQRLYVAVVALDAPPDSPAP